jgi:hypothetical protein
MTTTPITASALMRGEQPADGVADGYRRRATIKAFLDQPV